MEVWFDPVGGADINQEGDREVTEGDWIRMEQSGGGGS